MTQYPHRPLQKARCEASILFERAASSVAYLPQGKKNSRKKNGDIKIGGDVYIKLNI